MKQTEKQAIDMMQDGDILSFVHAPSLERYIASRSRLMSEHSWGRRYSLSDGDARTIDIIEDEKTYINS
jgi:hypothetical protein